MVIGRETDIVRRFEIGFVEPLPCHGMIGAENLPSGCHVHANFEPLAH